MWTIFIFSQAYIESPHKTAGWYTQNSIRDKDRCDYDDVSDDSNGRGDNDGLRCWRAWVRARSTSRPLSDTWVVGGLILGARLAHCTKQNRDSGVWGKYICPHFTLFVYRASVYAPCILWTPLPPPLCFLHQGDTLYRVVTETDRCPVLLWVLKSGCIAYRNKLNRTK
jgi:hypothetical protein